MIAEVRHKSIASLDFHHQLNRLLLSRCKKVAVCNFSGLADGWRGYSTKSRFRAVWGGQTGTTRNNGATETWQAAPDPHQLSVLPAPKFEQTQTRLGGMGRENEGAKDGQRIYQLQLWHRDSGHDHNDHGQLTFISHWWTKIDYCDHNHVDDSVSDVPVYGNRSVPGEPMSVIAASIRMPPEQKG